MKKLFWTIISISVLIVSSCGSRPNSQGEYIVKAGNSEKEIRIKFFEDGKVEYIREVKNDEPHGFFLNFYQNGNVKNLGNTLKGQKEGCGIVMYPNGKVNSIGEYKNDQQNGFFWLFNSKTELMEKREYLFLNNKNTMNQWIKFTENQKPVKEESNYISVAAVNDTIKFGEPFEMFVLLEASYNKEHMILIIGPYDENYELAEGSKCDTIVGRDFLAIYKTDKYVTGKNTIRGVVKDLKLNEEQTQTSSRNIYFSKDFYVYK